MVLCDTAGRLHNKANLMAELAKLSKIIDRECPGAARETLLVLDATTGQNGLIQARQFKEAAGLTGIVLTKLDGTAKGGIVIAIAKELGVPVKLAGVGEGVDDLKAFDAKEYVEAIIERQQRDKDHHLESEKTDLCVVAADVLSDPRGAFRCRALQRHQDPGPIRRGCPPAAGGRSDCCTGQRPDLHHLCSQR